MKRGAEAHTGAQAQGLVVAAYRRHFAVALDGGDVVSCVVKGRSTLIAVGDRAEITRAHDGAVIVGVAARTNLLYRSDAFREKALAANVSQIAGVIAPDISIDEDLVHRWMIAAEASRCRFLLIANKADLPSFAALRPRLEPYVALGCTVVELAAKRDARALLPWLADQHTVLVGQSGMGKSTIINALAPDAAARTTEVSEALQTGRHTTTATRLYRLPDVGRESWIVDSPGIKVFGLAHLEPDAIAAAFTELRPLVGRCRFRDCRHRSEPDCAVRAAVDEGRVQRHRLALLHALLAEAEAARDPAR